MIVVAKLGKHGAAALAGGRLYNADPIDVHATDTTGAGDSFNAGFLHLWLRGFSHLGSACNADRFAEGCRRASSADARVRLVGPRWKKECRISNSTQTIWNSDHNER